MGTGMDETAGWMDEELTDDQCEALEEEALQAIHAETDALRAHQASERAREAAPEASVEEWALAWSAEE
jgi:hypothetical protein